MIGTAGAEVVLFQDDFSGLNGDPLDGTTPDVTQGTAAWVADVEYGADGSLISGQSTRRAYLTLGALIDGNRGNADAIYTLSATVDVTAGSTAIWEAIGFWNDYFPASNFVTGLSNGNAWMLRRDNAQLRVFRGPKTANTLTESTASPNNVAGTVDLRVVLDLTDWNGADNWGSVTYFAKLASESLFTEVAAGELDAANSTFRAVGLSGGAVDAQVTAFELTAAGSGPPLAGEVLAAWDSWIDPATPYAPSTIAAGFTATVATATDRVNASFGSTDGNFGTVSGAVAGLGGLLVRENSGNLEITIEFTNNTGESYSIDSLHFDLGIRPSAANGFTLNYTSGGLGNPGTEIDSQSGLPASVGSSQAPGQGDYADFDYPLAGTLGDTILDDGESAIFTLVFSGNTSISASSIVDNIAFQGAPVNAELSPLLTGFTYDPVTGNCVVSIEGSGSTTYKLVEADDLDFASPDQDPVPLSAATVGTLDGNTVETTPGGDATIEFNLGTTKSATFIRAEEVTP